MCSEKVFRGWHHSSCSNPAIVERDGKGYCGVHDPEKVAKRSAAKQQALDLERESRDRLLDAARKRCSTLGVGRPAWDRRYGPDGGITLSAADTDKLIARLEAAESRVREYEA